MEFLGLFNWLQLSTPRLIFNIIAMMVIIGWTLYTLYLDHKYKELETWKIYVCVGLNYLFPIISAWVFGSDQFLRIFLTLSPVLFIIFDLLNAKFNKEMFVGQADLSTFLQQLFLSIAAGYSLSLIGKGTFTQTAILFVVELQFGMLFVGLVMTLILALLKTLIVSKTKKIKFKEVYKEERYVPSMKVFLPLMVLNLYILLGI